MHTKHHYIYDIKERLNDYADDSELSLEYISFLIDETRALIIRQSYRGIVATVPNTIKQQVNLELELSQENEFVDLDDILKSTIALPRLIEGSKVNKALQVDNGSYKDIKFITVPVERFPYVGNNKYLRTYVYWTLGNDYKLYFTSGNARHKLLNDVRVHGVFENPKDAWELSPDYDVDVDFNDTTYPIDSDMWVKISDIIMKILLPKEQIQEDKVNDAND